MLLELTLVEEEAMFAKSPLGVPLLELSLQELSPPELTLLVGN